MQPGDDAIPEAKVAFRGLLRRKRLAMTSRARNDEGRAFCFKFYYIFFMDEKNLISIFCSTNEMELFILV